MLVSSGKILLTLLFVVGAAQVLQAAPSSRILGGQVAYGGQFPYQVSVRRDRLHVCGGTIISRNYVLTAAQCVVQSGGGGAVQVYPVVYFTVRAGSIDRFTGGVVENVSEIKVHPDYGNLLNDVALLRLKNPLVYSQYIAAVPLSRTNIPANSMANVAGWGFNKPSVGYFEKILQWLSVRAVASSECNLGFMGENAKDSLMCFNNVATETGICNGDVGSSAVYNGQLVGMALFVLDRCGSSNPDVFINAAYYYDWIKKNSDI